MADQSEGIVQAYAEHLSRKAGSVVVTLVVVGTVLGAALAFTASKMPGGLISPGVRNFAILLGAISGGFLGRSIGEKRAAVLKLQAALALHQAQLAQRIAARPDAPGPAPATAPPVAPAPVTLAPIPLAPVPPVPIAAAPVAAVPLVAPALVAPAAVEIVPETGPAEEPAPLAVAPAPAPLTIASIPAAVPPVVSVAHVPEPEPEPEPEPAAVAPIVPVVPRLVEPAPAMPPLTPPLSSAS